MSDPEKIAKLQANLAGIEKVMDQTIRDNPNPPPAVMANLDNLATIVENSIAVEKAKP